MVERGAWTPEGCRRSLTGKASVSPAEAFAMSGCGSTALSLNDLRRCQKGSGAVPAEPVLAYVSSLSMAGHRFRVGDLVRVQVSVCKQPSAGVTNVVTLGRSSGIHEVTRLLPVSSDGEPLYQIRGGGGQRERVVRESELPPAVYLPQPRR